MVERLVSNGRIAVARSRLQERAEILQRFPTPLTVAEQKARDLRKLSDGALNRGHGQERDAYYREALQALGKL